LNFITDLLLVVAPSGKIKIGGRPVFSLSAYLSSILWHIDILSSLEAALSKNKLSTPYAISPTKGYFFTDSLDTKLGKK
jgi:hypothetical protein